MNLKKNELINLPVLTKSGQTLGRVSDFEIDSLSQKILKYYVKSNSLIKGLLARELMVAAEQVISITKEKMVVEDNLVKEPGLLRRKAKLAENQMPAMPVG